MWIIATIIIIYMWYQLIKIIVKEIKGRITAKENKVKGK